MPGVNAAQVIARHADNQIADSLPERLVHPKLRPSLLLIRVSPAGDKAAQALKSEIIDIRKCPPQLSALSARSARRRSESSPSPVASPATAAYEKSWNSDSARTMRQSARAGMLMRMRMDSTYGVRRCKTS